VFDAPNPLGSPVPPLAFSLIFLILGPIQILMEFRPGHTPERWDIVLGVLWMVLGVMYLLGDRRQRRLIAAEEGGVWVAAAKAQLAAGDKIAAINTVRAATHVGLAQAKQIVESWEQK